MRWNDGERRRRGKIRADIAEVYAMSGLTHAEVAKQFGVSESYVAKACRANGATSTVPRHGRVRPAGDIAAWIKAAKSGESFASIGRRYGVSRQTVNSSVRLRTG